MKSLLLSFLLLLTLPCSAQKAFKPVTNALKAKNYKEAIQQIKKLRADSTYRDNAKLCLYSIESNRGLNDAENTKIYLKKSYDTITFFSTTNEIIREAVKLNQLEKEIEKQESKKPKQTRFVCEQLLKYFPNLNAAARYYYKKENFKEAMPYLRTCLDLPHTELGQMAHLSTRGDEQNAIYYLVSAYNTKQYDEVTRYDSIALMPVATRPTIIKYLALTAEAKADTATYHHQLREGWTAYPHDAFFFTRLADFYNRNKQFDNTLRLSSQQLKMDSTYAAAYMAQCVAHYELHQYDSCIVSAQHTLACDSTYAEAHYYIGAAYVNKVDRVDMPDHITSRAYKKALAEQQELYKMAEPALETYQRMVPQAQKQWAPLLYKVYLALNRGKKFAEIEKLMQ